jgi:hypothetical protein
MFIVKAVDGTHWLLPSLKMARKFAWRKSWGYPRGASLEIFEGNMLIATETIWRPPNAPRMRSDQPKTGKRGLYKKENSN